MMLRWIEAGSPLPHQMIRPSALLPHNRFDTTPLGVEHRLEAWRESIGALFEVQPAEPTAAQAPVILDSWLLGSAILTVGSGPGFSYARTPQAVARDGKDLFLMQIYEAGQCHIVRGAPTATSEPGDLLVTDLTHPMTTQETQFRNINLVLPRSLLTPLLRLPDAHGGRVLRRNLALTRLARHHLRELVKQAPRLPVAQAAEVLGATVQLLAAALNGGVDPQTVSGVRSALAHQLRRFIEDHLHGHDLTPESLAARFGVSRATLYRLFASEGGIRNYVQRRRLARARLDLLRPAGRRMTVSEIGVAAGYSYAQDFIRAYRREFGISPGEERELGRLAGRRKQAPGEPRLPLWVKWVHGLG
jgi:AraC-like DNA-binding protein